MQEAEIAKEVVEKSYHWFFDAQVFWAAVVAFSGAIVGALAIYAQIRAKDKSDASATKERTHLVANTMLAESINNIAAVKARLDNFRASIQISHEAPGRLPWASIDIFELNIEKIGLLPTHTVRTIFSAIQSTKAIADMMPTILKTFKDIYSTRGEADAREYFNKVLTIGYGNLNSWIEVVAELQKLLKVKYNFKAVEISETQIDELRVRQFELLKAHVEREH